MVAPQLLLRRGGAQWATADPRALARGGFAAIVAVLALVLMLLGRTAAVPVREAAAPATAPRAPALEVPQTSEFVNRDGRYGLSYPSSWSITAHRTRTEITSPERDAIVSVGVAGKGSLQRGSNRFVRLLRDGYAGVTVDARTRDTVAGAPALAVAGAARNPEGERIRWMGVVVQRKARNILVAVYTHADADPARILPATQQIVSSLRFVR